MTAKQRAQRKWRAKNKKRVREYNRRYAATHERSAQRRAYRRSNAKRIAAYNRVYRKRNRLALVHANNRYPERRAARAAVNNAIASGRLKRKPCRVCRSPRSQAHHTDYRKPLKVDWLCRQHHIEEHHGI